MAKLKISSQSINKYKKELEEIFDGVTGNQRRVLDIQIQKVAFMMAQCDELEKTIQEEGSVEWFVNGSQEMWREHPAAKAYTTVTKSLLSYLEKMKPLIPKDKGKKSAMEQFAAKRANLQQVK
jgi:hypothetical protein